MSKSSGFVSDMKSFFNFSSIWLLLFVISILVRLPHFLSDHFFFDGDEAVVGIMANDFLAGRGFPIYFYGQNYGLATIEIMSVSLFIKIIGSGVWALKLGGLLVFSLGVTFIVKSFIRKAKDIHIIVIVAALLLLFPGWYLWGTMVRGGYVTSLLVVCVIFYITQCKFPNWKNLILVGFLTIIGYESQILILIPILPLIILWIFNDTNKWLHFIWFSVPILVIKLMLVFTINPTIVWNKPYMIFSIDNFLLQKEGFLSAYSNYFLYTESFEIPQWLKLLFIFSIILLFVLVLLVFKALPSRKKLTFLSILSMLIVQVGLMFFLPSYAPRYWIGFLTGLLVLIFYGLLHVESNVPIKVILTLLISTYLLALTNASDLKKDWNNAHENEVVLFDKLFKVAKNENIRGLYTTEADVQWKWNYLYGDQIPATFFSTEERTNRFKNQVIEYEKRDAYPIGILGYQGMYNGLGLFDEFIQNRIFIGSKYYLVTRATPEIIEEGKKIMR